MDYYPCDYCDFDCMHCYLGNPCLGCKDYDSIKQKCVSNGGCSQVIEEKEC